MAIITIPLESIIFLIGSILKIFLSIHTILSKTTYTSASTDLNNFKSNKQYKPGNYDPFTPKTQINSSVNSSTQANANSNTTISVLTSVPK